MPGKPNPITSTPRVAKRHPRAARWFLAFHCFTNYIKVTFLRGMSLRPLPPVESKHPNTRQFRIREGDPLDDELVASWIQQAAELPGDPLF